MLIFIKIDDDIETAKTEIPRLENICFFHDRVADQTYIITEERFLPIIEERLTVTEKYPYTEEIQQALNSVSDFSVAGNPLLIQ